MTTTMKGLLKGLRYISQIFDAEEEDKEQEMHIGFPTDVKHVAHIGFEEQKSSDDPPSWMKEYKSTSAPGENRDDSQAKGVSQDSYKGRSKSRKSTRSSKESSLDDDPLSIHNQIQETSSRAGGLPKKTRKKKSKETVSENGNTRKYKGSSSCSSNTSISTIYEDEKGISRGNS